MNANAIETASQTTAQPKKSGPWRWLGRGLLALVLIGVGAQVVYTYSRSEDWQLISNVEGLKIYSRKESGHNIKQFRGIFEVRGALSEFYLAMVDPVVADSRAVGWNSGRVIARENELAFWTAWNAEMPPPFQKRQYVVKHEFSQDKSSKQFVYKVAAAPEKLPADDCCVRVPVMGNSWKLTPTGDGKLSVEWDIDMNLGGMIPYFVQNQRIPLFMRNMPAVVQKMMQNEKYRNAATDTRTGWITE